MHLSARLCIALLAAFTVLDVAILATTGDGGVPAWYAGRTAAQVAAAGPARPVADESHRASAVATVPPQGAQPQGTGTAEPTARPTPRAASTASSAAAGPAPAAAAHPAARRPRARVAAHRAPARHAVTRAARGGRPARAARAATGPAAKHAGRPGARGATRHATRHAARHATRHAARPAAKPAPKRVVRRPAAHARRAPVRIPPRRTPGPTSYSHYLRSLTGTDSDLWRMYRLGQWDATRHLAGARHLVLLDIGGQVPYGIHLSTTSRFVSYWRLDRAVEAYVAGYHNRQKANAPVTIAIGTNNDLLTTQTSGKNWAWEVVNPVYRYARRFPGISIAGAVDLEPGFSAGVWRSRVWVVGFLQATTLPLIFNGSADGCSWTHAYSRCGNGWTAEDLAFVAGAWTSRITVLPQIYNSHMVGQWLQIAITAVREGGRRLRFWGPLTENGACGRDPNCPTMPGIAAWLSLWRALNRYAVLAPGELPTRTDLDVR